jgi:hypothetical protein
MLASINPHNPIALANMAKAVLVLRKKFTSINKKNTAAKVLQMRLYTKYVEDFEKLIQTDSKLRLDEELKQALIFIRTKIVEQKNGFHFTELFVDGKTQEISFILQEIYALVCKDTLDRHAYNNLADCLKKVYRSENPSYYEICNALLKILKYVDPDLPLITDPNSYISASIIEYLKNALSTTFPDEKKLFSLTIEYLKNPLNTEFFAFLDAQKEPLQQILKEKYLQAGVNPENGKIKTQIEQYCSSLQSFFPINSFINGSYLKIIFQGLKPDDNPYRNKAIGIAKDIASQCQTFAQIPVCVIDLCSVSELYVLLHQYKDVLRCLEGPEIAKQISNFETLINTWYANFPNYPIDCPDFRKGKTEFIKCLTVYKEDPSGLNSFIENFFELYRTDLDKKVKQYLLGILCNKEIRGKITLPDTLLHEILSKNISIAISETTKKKRRELYLQPVILNTILLHALLTPFDKWTETVHSSILSIINFFNEDSLSLEESKVEFYYDFLPIFTVLLLAKNIDSLAENDFDILSKNLIAIIYSWDTLYPLLMLQPKGKAFGGVALMCKRSHNILKEDFAIFLEKPEMAIRLSDTLLCLYETNLNEPQLFEIKTIIFSIIRSYENGESLLRLEKFKAIAQSLVDIKGGKLLTYENLLMFAKIAKECSSPSPELLEILNVLILLDNQNVQITPQIVEILVKNNESITSKNVQAVVFLIKNNLFTLELFTRINKATEPLLEAKIALKKAQASKDPHPVQQAPTAAFCLHGASSPLTGTKENQQSQPVKSENQNNFGYP